MEFHRPAVFNGEAFWLSFSAVNATASEPTVSFSRVSLVAQIREALINMFAYVSLIELNLIRQI